MEVHEIKAALRSETGKGVARKLRADRRIPAVVYGAGGEATALTMNPTDLVLLRKSALGWNQPVALKVDGGSDVGLAVLKDVQRHPISREFLHADFQAVDAEQYLNVEVPIVLTGKSKGVELGGKLAQPLRTLKLRCRPADIPQKVALDITDLDVEDKIMLSDVPLAEGVLPGWRENATIVAVARGRGMKK
jgi:large subunit ribosomal protein L25